MKTTTEAHASMYRRICRMDTPAAHGVFAAPKRTRDRVAMVLTNHELTPAERGEIAAAYLTTECAFADGTMPPSPTALLAEMLTAERASR